VSVAKFFVLLSCVCLVTLAGGCDSSSSSTGRSSAQKAVTQGGLFESVADNLNHVEEFETAQVLRQVCDRLNQWYLQEKPQVQWQIDPLIDKLPNEYKNLLSVKQLDSTQYQLPDDAWYLLQTVWLRDISRVARGDQFEDLAVAERLFDWTIRNVQLEGDPKPGPEVILRRPFETLLYGRGTAEERAWVFLLLARQQGLDVGQLSIAADGQKPRPWASALLANNELYLFDTRLGMPIPGPEGKGVATLAQVVANPALLRRLDLDAEHPYWISADDLAHVVAYVEGSPHDLSRRMALVESRLSGKQKMSLTSPGSELADRVRKLPNVTSVQLWSMPFEFARWQANLTETGIRLANRDMYLFQALPTVITGRSREPLTDDRGNVVVQPQPTLLTARALHFKGMLDGVDGAKSHYLRARPVDSIIDNFKLPLSVSKELRPEDLPRVEAAQVVTMRRAKQNATYWLGLAHFEQQHYDEAVDFFGKRTLEAAPNGPWTDGARYNLARTFEAQGKADEAATLLAGDKKSAQSHGNQLRARLLKESTTTAPAETTAAEK